MDGCTEAGGLFMLRNDLALTTCPEGESCRKLPGSACFDFGIIQEMGLKLCSLFPKRDLDRSVCFAVIQFLWPTAIAPVSAVVLVNHDWLLHFLWHRKPGALAPGGTRGSRRCLGAGVRIMLYVSKWQFISMCLDKCAWKCLFMIAGRSEAASHAVCYVWTGVSVF